MRTVVIAGPNGTGKSTFAAEYLGAEGGSPPIVNGDDIAAELNPADLGTVAARAARIALTRMDALAVKGADFMVESTFSGQPYAVRLRRWQARGYRVSIVYQRLSSTDQAVERVARRVVEGGHHVPEAVVRRRFERSRSNFLELHRDVADEWRVYDNSEPPILMARSPDWRSVLERRVSGYAESGTRRRIMPTKTPYRFPEGEPSDDSVLAAFLRARNRAMARAAVARRGKRGEMEKRLADRRPEGDGTTEPLVIACGERDG